MIRLLDLFFSVLGLIIISPFFLLTAVLIKFTSTGPIFFKQIRVGENGRHFSLYKFRTMYTGSEKKGFLTVGNHDKRITSIGKFLRKFKLDELPQLLNVVIGNMSLVGPRPEVPFYVDRFSNSQRKILAVKPGITDWASIEFSNENDLLSLASDPEDFYLNEILPQKIALNMRYINNQSLRHYFEIILQTFKKIFN